MPRHDMLRVHAFEALRPAGSRAALVSCPAHGEAPTTEPCGCCTDAASYRQVLEAPTPDEARRIIERLESQGILAPDPQPCMYVYRIARQGRRQIGVVAAVDRSAMDPIHSTPTLGELSPIWAEPATALFDDSASVIAELAADDMNERPLFHFNAGDGTTHSGWLARDPNKYVVGFASLPGRARLVRPGACAGCDRILTLLLDASSALDPLPIPRCGLFVQRTALVT